MARRTRFLASISLSLLWLAACAGSDAPSGDGDCVNDAECFPGVCIGGECVADGDTDEDPSTDLGSDIGTLDTGNTDTGVDSEDDPGIDTGPPPGSFGAPCERDEECDSGFCIATREGRVCTSRCNNDDECLDDWVCRLIENSGGDLVEICVPVQEVLCQPCGADIECGALDDLCIGLTNGDFCAEACASDDDCPERYSCEDVTRADGTFSQCVPELGFCGDCLDQDGDDHGIGQGCAGTDCDDLDNATYEGAPEICDGLDNDCNDDVDEDFDLTTDLTHCGGCGIVCTAENVTESVCAESLCGVVTCADGFWDVNGEFDDGCEYACTQNADTMGEEICNDIDDDCDGAIDETFDFENDNANCGSCGNQCALDGADTECRMGACRIANCQAPFEDCNTLTEDGCEIDLSTSMDHCGGCDMACAPANAAAMCDLGTCSITSCDNGFIDCDGLVDTGCEVNSDVDLMNCGTCGTTCSYANGVAECVGGACNLDMCDMGYGSCDGNLVTGCETDLLTDLDHCGACGAVCNLANATHSCIAGDCTLEMCDMGYDDCNMVETDGCEIDLLNDAVNCGSCGTVCVVDNGTPTCEMGACAVLECDPGFADCDGDPTNGCEVNTLESTNNCGTCGNACTYTDGIGICSSGSCELAGCSENFGNCDSNPDNGCETPLTFNPFNCGACGNACDFSNGTGFCNGTTCELVGCSGTFENCDMDPANGCEVNRNADANNCGSCGNVCSLPFAQEACMGGICTIATCDAGRADCNMNPFDGCEVDLLTDVNNCNTCGNVCTVGGGSAICSGGACGVGTCAAPREDCDGMAGNGCEVDTSNDVNNCGGCGDVCNVPNADEVCSSSSCSISSCQGVFEDCNGLYEDGCEADLTSTAHCGGCGLACNFENASGICNASTTCELTSCNTGFFDLNGSADDGCEYACTFTSSTDNPDDGFVDANCDGVDGNINTSVFVSIGEGDPGNSGLTPDEPVDTILLGMSIALSTPGRNNVLIASGNYSGGTLDLVNGINLYGGYSDDFFSRGNNRPTYNSTSNVGVSASGLSNATVVDRINFSTPNQTVTGRVSIGLRVSNSGSNLNFRYSNVHAGEGGNGSPGNGGNNGSAGQNGQNGSGSTGGNNAGSPGGGNGGNGRRQADGNRGSNGLSNGSACGGTGGGGGDDTGCADGDPTRGGDGSAGCNGSSGSNGNGGNSTGSLSGTTWSPSNGTGGTSGARGGGGGGGGAGGGEDCTDPVFGGCIFCGTGRGGGEGGGGGAGGQGGSAGTGGGASIGILVHNSTLGLHQVAVSTEGGGDGGAGGARGVGGAGGQGGTGAADGDNTNGNGGNGGNGGRGGDGGCGGGGGGGPSVSVWGSGSATILTSGSVTYSTGPGGAGGNSCTGGASGSNGISQNTRSVTVTPR